MQNWLGLTSLSNEKGCVWHRGTHMYKVNIYVYIPVVSTCSRKPHFTTAQCINDQLIDPREMWQFIVQNNSLDTHWWIILRWMPQNLTNEKSTLVQVMAWCRKATSHCLNQCWFRTLSAYGVTRPQLVTLTYHWKGYSSSSNNKSKIQTLE